MWKEVPIGTIIVLFVKIFVSKKKGKCESRKKINKKGKEKRVN